MYIKIKTTKENYRMQKCWGELVEHSTVCARFKFQEAEICEKDKTI